MLYFLCAVLFCVGLWGVFAQRNMIKIAVAICIIEYAIFLFFGLVGYKADAHAPIVEPPKHAVSGSVGEAAPAAHAGPLVDPLPQALVLTAIVIGLGTTALLLATTVRIYEKYGTLDIREVRRLRE